MAERDLRLVRRTAAEQADYEAWAAASGYDGATIAVMAVMAIVAVLASGLLACWRLDGGDMDWSVVTAPWLSTGLLFLVLLVASIEDAVEAIRARRTR